ncbi:hypothetical protein PbJCM13498_21080 [Prolixibacter bellariivorans]|uniref:Uncharacterized protein n=1 Tax=Prolixibacter bellariivorans TaxID=314319 RepID=A0A5M4AZD8_9BACT|nr:HEPN domain-containing protein [Prolixibacter bellariivorans]GET33245.1 hypothetical protein PbJCM13498_21080 [Prolixibacter bellariivorans]
MDEIECKLLVGLHDIQIDTNLKKGVELDTNVFLTNDKGIIKELIPEKLIPVIGLNEYHNLLSLNAFVYATIKIPKKKFDERTVLTHFLELNALLCQAFWLIKDNSVKMELGHLIYRKDNYLNTHSNYLSSMYTTQLGDSKLTKFSSGEIQHIGDLQRFLFFISQNKTKQKYTKLVKEHNRVQRAFLFIQSARCATDIGIKVAEFCTAFECLFAVSTSELKHRLAEIISILLGKEKKEKLEIYKHIQKAYDLRSAVVHGDSIPSRYSKMEFQLLKETSNNCDEYLRQIFNDFISDENLLNTFIDYPKDELQDYFLGLLFKE